MKISYNLSKYCPESFQKILIQVYCKCILLLSLLYFLLFFFFLLSFLLLFLKQKRQIIHQFFSTISTNYLKIQMGLNFSFLSKNRWRNSYFYFILKKGKKHLFFFIHPFLSSTFFSYPHILSFILSLHSFTPLHLLSPLIFSHPLPSSPHSLPSSPHSLLSPLIFSHSLLLPSPQPPRCGDAALWALVGSDIIIIMMMMLLLLIVIML